MDETAVREQEKVDEMKQSEGGAAFLDLQIQDSSIKELLRV